jgi:OOP family OmpA-OmpF porin
MLEEGALQLGGNVPDDEARQWILKRAREQLPSTEVRDGLQLGLGHPAGWQACVEAALAGLGRAGNGTAQLRGDRLEVLVSTRSNDLAQSFANEVRTSVAGKCEADVRVTLLEAPEPAFNWAASHNGKELVFSGHFAGTDAREQLLGAAQRLFPHAQVLDRTVIAEQKSVKWTRAANEALSLLGRLRSGEVELAERELTLSGEAADASIQSAVREALAKNLPEGYRGRETVTVRSDPEAAAPQATATILPRPRAQEAEQNTQVDKCQSLLQGVVRTGTIHFDRDSAELTPASVPTLRRLVDVINNCANVRLEVAGYTDADGRPEHNQVLSEQRAHSIVEFLTNAGVRADRMRAVGYGESRPVVGNDTPREKALNRRIEFTVKTD